MPHKTFTNQFLRMNKRFNGSTATALAALFLSNSGRLNAQPQFTVNRLASDVVNPWGEGAGANGNPETKRRMA